VTEDAVDGDIEVSAAARQAELSQAMRALFAANGWTDERDALGARPRAESAATVSPPGTIGVGPSLVENLIRAYGEPEPRRRKSPGDAGGR
jgi:hypothetical protein